MKMFKDAFNNVDWLAFRWILASCSPFLLALVFLVIHIADIRDDRKVAKSLRARVKALKHGDKAYWDAPKAGPIHYIEPPYKMPTIEETTAFFKEAAKVGISVKDAKEGLEKAKAYIHKEKPLIRADLIDECEHGTDFAFECEACNEIK